MPRRSSTLEIKTTPASVVTEKDIYAGFSVAGEQVYKATEEYQIKAILDQAPQLIGVLAMITKTHPAISFAPPQLQHATEAYVRFETNISEEPLTVRASGTVHFGRSWKASELESSAYIGLIRSIGAVAIKARTIPNPYLPDNEAQHEQRQTTLDSPNWVRPLNISATP